MFMFITLERDRLIKRSELSIGSAVRGRARLARLAWQGAAAPPRSGAGARPGARGPGGGGRPLVQSKLHGKL